MEKLSKRSDGIFETQSGNFAVLPVRTSGRDGETQWFDFKPASWEDTIRIRWPLRDKIAVIDQTYAMLMFNLGYGRTITEELADEWNERIEEIAADALQPESGLAGATLTLAGTTIPAEGAEPEGGAGIGAETPSLTPPEVIAKAAAAATAPHAPETVIEGVKVEENSGDENTETSTSQEDQSSSDEDSTEVEETSGKKTKKRSLS